MSGSHQKVTLAIDLGARYTGLFLVSHPADRVPTAADAKAMTLVMPQDTTDMTYSMTARRAARHRMRGYKRFKRLPWNRRSRPRVFRLLKMKKDVRHRPCAVC